MDELGLLATALGKHELDADLPELLRKARGEWPTVGCIWPGFINPSFPYLAVRLYDAATGKT